MTKASENQFPSILAVNTSNASISNASPWNAQRLFFDADGTLKRKDSGGTVTAVEGGGSITFGGVASTDTVSVASNFAVSDQGGGEARLDVFFPSSGSATFVGAKAYASSTQSLGNASYAAVTFGAEDYDTGTIHDNSTNPSRFTAPSDGVYLFTGMVLFAVSGSGNVRALQIRVNGTATSAGGQAMFPSALTSVKILFSTTLSMTAGQYAEVYAYQDTGGSLTLGHASSRPDQCEASFVKLGEL